MEHRVKRQRSEVGSRRSEGIKKGPGVGDQGSEEALCWKLKEKADVRGRKSEIRRLKTENSAKGCRREKREREELL